MAWAIAPVLASIKPTSIIPTSMAPNSAAPVKQRSLKGPVIGKSILLHTARQRAHLARGRLPVQSADSDQASTRRRMLAIRRYRCPTVQAGLRNQ
jgi:hypothetical protein